MPVSSLKVVKEDIWGWPTVTTILKVDIYVQYASTPAKATNAKPDCCMRPYCSTCY